jgi:hypothetical protein
MRARRGDVPARTAYQTLLDEQPLTRGDCKVMYDELDRWLTETSDDQVGPELTALRDALATDLAKGTATHPGSSNSAPPAG